MILSTNVKVADSFGLFNLNINDSDYSVIDMESADSEFLQAKLGSSFTPPLEDGTEFDDVVVGSINAAWIEKLNTDGFTDGCAINKFCSDMVLTRGQVAKIFLKIKEGKDYIPSPSSSSYFSDTPLGSFNAAWIADLREKGFSQGCVTGINNYCPNQPVTRKWFDYLKNML